MRILNVLLATTSLVFFSPTFLEFESFKSIQNTFNSVELQEQKPILSFSSAVQYGSQKNQLTVLVSTDFSGDYEEEDINKANWESLNPNLTLATGEEETSSGDIDLTNAMKNNKICYVAFQYKGETPKEGRPTQRSWRISNLKFNNKSISGARIVNSSINDVNTGWRQNGKNLVFVPFKTLNQSAGWIIVKVTTN